MYLDFFGLAEKPFTITPNPRFLFLSRNHKEVFAHLLFGIRSRCGFIEVTGEVGTGKTTVLRTLLNQLGEEGYPLAFIFNPSLSALELLRAINREFGIPADGGTGEELLSVLNAFLLRENAAGRTVVLVIDEAQNLAPTVLEQIRLLSNLETETDKLIQIVLVGQPELGEALARSELRQLSQRIAVRYHLCAMGFEDTKAYLSHRLTVAGSDREIFTSGAIKRIYRFSGGLPRLINILGDRALLVGYADGHRRISSGQVKIAIDELRRQRQASVLRRFWPVLTIVAVVFAGLGFYIGSTESSIGARAWLPEGRSKTAKTDALPPSAVDLVSVHREEMPPPVVPAGPVLEVLQGRLADLDERQNLAQAFAALQRSWRIEPAAGSGIPSGLREVAQRVQGRGMHLTRVQGGLDAVLKLDSPALLEILLPGVAGRRYLALTEISGDGAVTVPPLNGEAALDLQSLRRLWTGRAYVPWRNYRKIPSLAVPGSKGEKVVRLQELLRDAGVYDGPMDGIYNRQTIGAVTRFQGMRGIVQDGRVGPQTLLLLYQSAGTYGAPDLGAAAEGGGA